MQRNKAIDAVKGFAILLVMLGHCIVLNGLHTSDPYIYDSIKSVQMPLFMLVSGVVTGWSAAKKRAATTAVSLGDRINDLGRKIRKRAQSCLLPFFSWFILVYLYTHSMAGTLSVSGFFNELTSLLLQTDRGLWFLMTLFVVTIMVMLAQLVADQIFGNGKCGEIICFLTAAALLYVLFFLQSRSGNTFLSPSLTVQYFPFYLLGYTGSRYVHGNAAVQKWRQQRKVVFLGNVMLLLMLAAFLFMVIRYDLNAPVTGFDVLLLQMTASLLGALVCFFGVYQAASFSGTKGARSLSFLGQYTLEIYVLHFRFARILQLADKNLRFYSLRGFFWLAAAFVLMSALTFLCIFLIKKVWLLDLLLFGKTGKRKA